VKRAITLSWFTIIYNLIEGVVSIRFGVADDSTSLVGFGVDSLIEVASASIVLWRFRGESGLAEVGLASDREKLATRGIGALFTGLALFTAISALLQFRSNSHPETTVPGVIVSTLSLSFMFFLWKAKKRVAMDLDSRTMERDAACSLACIQLSFILFFGSILFLVFPSLWWADGVASLALSYFIGREGVETFRASFSTDFEGGCGCG